jgi:hypothetical protein
MMCMQHYVSTIQAINYPFTGTQWHPEVRPTPNECLFSPSFFAFVVPSRVDCLPVHNSSVRWAEPPIYTSFFLRFVHTFWPLPLLDPLFPVVALTRCTSSFLLELLFNLPIQVLFLDKIVRECVNDIHGEPLAANFASLYLPQWLYPSACTRLVTQHCR